MKTANQAEKLMPEIRAYLDLKLQGFRQDYSENHCIVQTCKNLLEKCDRAIAKINKP
jgi:hypothetical protein